MLARRRHHRFVRPRPAAGHQRARALLPYSNTPHYDSEEQRRPLYQSLVASGELPAGWATDDGVGLHYRGTEFVEAVVRPAGRLRLAGRSRGQRRRRRGAGDPDHPAPARPAVAWKGAGTHGSARIGYEQAWAYQRDVCTRRARPSASPTPLLLLEHPSVYTAGPAHRARTSVPPTARPVIDVDRGGKITWHGPGQLVGYPIVRLPDPVDVVAYVRRLEAALIAACAELGLDSRPGRGPLRASGRPDGARKIAAIGIRVSRGVTMHGFALNCDPDLSRV